jgi:hypothetical protein
VVGGFSFGIGIGLYSTLFRYDDFLGIVDLSGTDELYRTAKPELLKVRWILSFAGALDEDLASKIEAIDGLNARAQKQSAQGAVVLQHWYLENDNHMLLFPESWNVIFVRIAEMLNAGGLIDTHYLGQYESISW